MLNMKKLGKLSINPEKVIKNDELVNLKGGYDDPCTCTCYNHLTMECYGYMFAPTGDCNGECKGLYGENARGVCGNAPWCQ
jgi:natural product precursor